MSDQRAPQQNGCQCGMCFFLAMEGSKYCVAHRGIMESFDRKRAASLPESQPSPSGDFHKELREKISLIKLYPDMDAQEFYERMEEFIVRVLRSHDAKVSGKAEQRLRLQEAVHELIAAERKLLPVCPIVTHHKSDCVYCDLIGKRISVEAALQESPGGR